MNDAYGIPVTPSPYGIPVTPSPYGIPLVIPGRTTVYAVNGSVSGFKPGITLNPAFPLVNFNPGRKIVLTPINGDSGQVRVGFVPGKPQLKLVQGRIPIYGPNGKIMGFH